MIPPSRKATFIGGGARRKAYGKNHPLAIPRVSLTFDLIKAYGALKPEELRRPRKAADRELTWFHTREYVSAIKRCEALGKVNNGYRREFRLGTLENPYFEGLYSIPAAATGASVQAAEEVIAGRIGFNPAGGMHHARAGHAQGFCYFNDPVLGILRLKREGWRVLYLDLDAHHGDGVEEAFLGDPDVLTLSLHMDTSYAYPFRGGRFEDAGNPEAGHTTINLPLPQGVHDGEYRVAFDAVWPGVVSRFRPDVMVLQAGADMLAADPLGKFRITTQCFLEIAAKVIAACPCHPDGTPRLLVTGGGGYHPLLVARAWTGLWALLSGRMLPEAIPGQGQALLRAAGWGEGEEDEGYLFASRVDPEITAAVRPEITALAERIQSHPFFAA
ncbi:MAG: acetoin utilization protein AcuC [Betaproteobacteria bacterium]|nr:acetoin utilization protein AcuC [Betaproteobacteria bacterium]